MSLTLILNKKNFFSKYSINQNPFIKSDFFLQCKIASFLTISLWRGSYTNISYRPDGIERGHTGKYRHPSNQGVAKVTSS